MGRRDLWTTRKSGLKHESLPHHGGPDFSQDLYLGFDGSTAIRQ
jgi:hypothetical protein